MVDLVRVPSVTLDLLLDPPPKGQVQISFRAIMVDKHAIDVAAATLGMMQSDYLRMITVQASQKVIEEAKAEMDRRMAEPELDISQTDKVELSQEGNADVKDN